MSVICKMKNYYILPSALLLIMATLSLTCTAKPNISKTHRRSDGSYGEGQVRHRPPPLHQREEYKNVVESLVSLKLFREGVDLCDTKPKELRQLCQRCAKGTKSLVAYQLCCAGLENSRDWCQRLINFGISQDDT